VRFDHGVLRYARVFMHRLMGRKGPAPGDDLLDAAAGDVFLGLDLSAHIVPHHMETFEQLRRIGVAMNFVVYDLIPWRRPDSVNPDSLQLLWAWYRSIGVLADGLCCISASVASDLVDWCDEVRPARLRPLRIGHFHLAAELAESAAPGMAPVLPPSRRPRFLMVGTVEPRKGHVQALAAFERLWEGGHEVELVIAGKRGWLMDEFAQRLQSHPERGQRLHWLDALDDAGLDQLYTRCSALLAASEEEGFGLPIVEAAARGLPVIARDIPVFREVAGEHALYFRGLGREGLADAVLAWLSLAARQAVPDSRAMPRLDWKDSARALVALVLHQQWTSAWMPGQRRLFPARDQRFFQQVGGFDRTDRICDGRAGFLTYGPYVAAEAGHYRLRMLGAWDGDGGGTARLEVIAGQGALHAADLAIEAGAMAGEGVIVEHEFDLSLDVPDLELRLFVQAGHRLRLRGFELVRLSAESD
jgi:glycosyltransferase involved in cell wall biosynthesis